jgi:hypothetical protein
MAKVIVSGPHTLYWNFVEVLPSLIFHGDYRKTDEIDTTYNKNYKRSVGTVIFFLV